MSLRAFNLGMREGPSLWVTQMLPSQVDSISVFCYTYSVSLFILSVFLFNLIGVGELQLKQLAMGKLKTKYSSR